MWALPTPGGPGDFPRLVALMASFDPSQSASSAIRALFAIRWRVGELLGWDEPTPSRRPGADLRDRLPADLRDAQLARRMALTVDAGVRERERLERLARRRSRPRQGSATRCRQRWQ